MKRVKSRFTLIEMLAVAAIASILIALITPAVQAMLFGSRVDNYTSSFKLGMERAQSKAVSARKYVAMVLPSNHSSATDAVLPPMPFSLTAKAVTVLLISKKTAMITNSTPGSKIGRTPTTVQCF